MCISTLNRHEKFKMHIVLPSSNLKEQCKRYSKKPAKELKWNTKKLINSKEGRRGEVNFHETDGITKQQITMRLGFNHINNYIKYKGTKPSDKAMVVKGAKKQKQDLTVSWQRGLGNMLSI